MSKGKKRSRRRRGHPGHQARDSLRQLESKINQLVAETKAAKREQAQALVLLAQTQSRLALQEQQTEEARRDRAQTLAILTSIQQQLSQPTQATQLPTGVPAVAVDSGIAIAADHAPASAMQAVIPGYGYEVKAAEVEDDSGELVHAITDLCSKSDSQAVDLSSLLSEQPLSRVNQVLANATPSVKRAVLTFYFQDKAHLLALQPSAGELVALLSHVPEAGPEIQRLWRGSLESFAKTVYAPLAAVVRGVADASTYLIDETPQTKMVVLSSLPRNSAVFGYSDQSKQLLFDLVASNGVGLTYVAPWLLEFICSRGGAFFNLYHAVQGEQRKPLLGYIAHAFQHNKAIFVNEVSRVDGDDRLLTKAALCHVLTLLKRRSFSNEKAWEQNYDAKVRLCNQLWDRLAENEQVQMDAARWLGRQALDGSIPWVPPRADFHYVDVRNREIGYTLLERSSTAPAVKLYMLGEIDPETYTFKRAAKMALTHQPSEESSLDFFYSLSRLLPKDVPDWQFNSLNFTSVKNLGHKAKLLIGAQLCKEKFSHQWGKLRLQAQHESLQQAGSFQAIARALYLILEGCTASKVPGLSALITQLKVTAGEPVEGEGEAVAFDGLEEMHSELDRLLETSIQRWCRNKSSRTVCVPGKSYSLVTLLNVTGWLNASIKANAEATATAQAEVQDSDAQMHREKMQAMSGGAAAAVVDQRPPPTNPDLGAAMPVVTPPEMRVPTAPTAPPAPDNSHLMPTSKPSATDDEEVEEKDIERRARHGAGTQHEADSSAGLSRSPHAFTRASTTAVDRLPEGKDVPASRARAKSA